MATRLSVFRLRATALLLAIGIPLGPAPSLAGTEGPNCPRAVLDEPASAVVLWDEAAAALRAVVAISPATDARMTVFVHCGAQAVEEGVDDAAAPLSTLVFRAFQLAQQRTPEFRSRFMGAVKEAARHARDAGTEDLNTYRHNLETALHDDLFADRIWLAEWSVSLLAVLTESGRTCADCPLPVVR